MKYSIDSSALIHLRHFSRDVHIGMWNNICDLVTSKNIFATMEVKLELKKRDNGVRKLWEKVNNNNNQKFFRDPQKNEVRIAKQIMNKYKEFHPPKNYSETGIWADPYVIALAKVKNATVISQESPKSGGNIPFVCYKEGIECMDLDKFMAYNKWKFY